MTRGASRLAAGIAAAVVVAGIVTLVRSNGPAPPAEVESSAPTGTSTAIAIDNAPLTAPDASTTVTTVESTPTTTAGNIDSTGLPIEAEPAVELLEGPVTVEISGGKAVSVEGDEKGNPVAQAVTVTGPTTSTILDEPAIDFAEDPGPAEPKDTTPSTAVASRAGAGSGSTREGRMYTYQDGDSTMQVWLEPDLVVKSDAAVGPLQDAVVEVEGGNGVRSDAGDAASGWPVFRSRSGSLMTLPGGVLLVLDPAWDEAETDAFFSRNGIKQALVSELGYLPNGFFVETDPGFPSLNLANELATQDGVELSSPNWWRERSTR